MSDPEYEEIRKRVEQRFNKQKELSIHAMVFFIINGLFWGLWLVGGQFDLPIIGGLVREMSLIPPVIITLGWSVGLIGHAIDYYYSVGGGARRRDRVIQQEIEREMALRRSYEKPK